MKITPITPAEYENITKAKKTPKIPTQTINTSTEPTAAETSAVGKIHTEMFVLPYNSTGETTTHERYNLPSRGFFYRDRKDIVYRNLKIRDLNKIQQYLNKDEITYLIDAIQDCVTNDIDVRDLTWDDFCMLALRIAFASHNKPEVSIQWLSLYNNYNTFTLTPNHFDVRLLDVDAVRKLNINFDKTPFFPCSVRSYEFFHINKHSEDNPESWSEEETTLYWDAARFIKADTPEAQVDYVQNIDVGSVEFQQLKDFIRNCKHEVFCKFTAVDNRFDAPKALEQLRSKLDRVNQLDDDTYNRLMEDMFTSRLFNRDVIQKEILRIETLLQNGMEVAPVEETVPFRVDISDLIQPLSLR